MLRLLSLALVETAMGKAALRAEQTTGEQSEQAEAYDVEPKELEDDIELEDEISP